MRSILVLFFSLLSAGAMATTTSKAKLTFPSSEATAPSSTSSEASATSTAIKSTASSSTKNQFELPTAQHLYLSTNFVSLSQSKGNLGLDLIVNDNFSAAFRFLTSTEKEDVKRNKTTKKMVVDRSSYSLGMSYYPMGLNNKFNLILSPALSFGVKKDVEEVETQNGLSVKVTGLVRVQNNLAAEVGFMGDNLENAEFKGDLYAGLGFLF